jgi:ribosomal-protein-alanine N-acetyltransferase
MEQAAGVLVRRMTLADCDALEPLAAELGGVDPRQELARDLTRAWVAHEPTSPVALGYALGWWVVDELQLLAVGTLPAARRRGVAQSLLGHVIEAATGAGGRRISLEVARNNVAAVRLYETAGFRVFNVRRNYYAKTGEDALEMALELGR